MFVCACAGTGPFCPLFLLLNTRTHQTLQQDLREALGKLQLNDAALKFEPEVNNAMGFGFRCGFLGLLHMEIVQERLEREYDLDLVTTAPTVVYRCTVTDGTERLVNSPGDLPEATKREGISEPYCRLEMVTPKEYVGPLMDLATGRRGEFVEMKYLTDSRTTLVFDIPLAEVVTDYFDQLKSRSKGYASMEYKVGAGVGRGHGGGRAADCVRGGRASAGIKNLDPTHTRTDTSLTTRPSLTNAPLPPPPRQRPCPAQLTGYRRNDLVLLEVRINGEPAEPLSVIVHRDAAFRMGKALCLKLKELIPRQMFKVPIQAAIGGKIIASEQIAPYRKDVLAKCYVREPSTRLGVGSL